MEDFLIDKGNRATVTKTVKEVSISPLRREQPHINHTPLGNASTGALSTQIHPNTTTDFNRSLCNITQ